MAEKQKCTRCDGTGRIVQLMNRGMTLVTNCPTCHGTGRAK